MWHWTCWRAGEKNRTVFIFVLTFLLLIRTSILNIVFLFTKFRNVTEYLVGADLSPSIIEEAMKTRPELYNETKVGDVTEAFREMKPIDLIIAADSYIYFGDLNPLFEAMAEGLIDNGIVAFTLENPSKEYEEK
jgi:predicted TPR repeat methyltransferase